MSVDVKVVKKAAEAFAGDIKDGFVVGLGTSDLVLPVIKEIRRRILQDDLRVKVVPTSLRVANLLSEFKIPLSPLGNEELDLCLEFADRVDSNLNFVKSSTHSLIRDKMVALSSKEVVVVVPDQPLMVLNGLVPFEVSAFGAAATLRALNVFGPSSIRRENGRAFATDGSNLVVDVEIDKAYDVEDVDSVCKRIPGVLESGAFYHIADKAVFLSDEVKIKRFRNRGKLGSIPRLKK